VTESNLSEEYYLDHEIMIYDIIYGNIRQKLGNLLLMIYGYFLFVSRKTRDCGRPPAAQGSMETQRRPIGS